MIPVSEPLLAGNEKKYLCQAIDEGEISSGGRFVREFEEAFAKWAGTKYAVAVNTGTSALECAVWASRMNDINIPAGTIISCFFASIRGDSGISLRDNGDAHNYPEVMRVHMFGELDKANGLKIIDDCSQYWAKFNHTQVSVYSLYANKLISSGEGGIIVTNYKSIYDRARSYRNLCHTEERFVHDGFGYNYRMSNMQGAVALAQLEQINRHIDIKQHNRDLYKKYLSGVKILFDNDVPWMYLISTEHGAGEVVKEMYTRGVECRRFFYPIHRQPFLNPREHHNFPVADNLWEHAFYLPSGLTLTEKDIKIVCNHLQDTLTSMKASTKTRTTKKK